jgi:DNA-directed RNA polymerase specialized sigma24 family protein
MLEYLLDFETFLIIIFKKKCISRLRKAEQRARVLEEISILKELNSPYIIQFIASYHTNKEIILGRFIS